ncbi:MAG: hypothetical protein DLM58_24100 [Pseudonocardiales bacterium]|nr:MAG: hypothetical protein DLM58_24100 [Pseudonocardiales bacterium]
MVLPGTVATIWCQYLMEEVDTYPVKTPTRNRVLRLAREPRRLPAAVMRRIVPRSKRFGFPWVHLPDGSVTFRVDGFVAASSPPMLLARHNFEVARIRRELHEVHAARSLEIGCGFGRLSPTLVEHSDEHTAIDINAEAIATARQTYPGINFQVGSADALALQDQSVGLIVTWTVLQHIRPERIERACAEILRVLAPKGVLLVCEETCLPDESIGHTWHRRVSEYEELLAPLTLAHHGPIDEIQLLPGMTSPGEVMLFYAI